MKYLKVNFFFSIFTTNIKSAMSDMQKEVNDIQCDSDSKTKDSVVNLHKLYKYLSDRV